MLVVNLRNMSENKVNAGEFVATFKIPCMGYLHSGKLQDCLRLSFQNLYRTESRNTVTFVP